jgi:hypothetical protein
MVVSSLQGRESNPSGGLSHHGDVSLLSVRRRTRPSRPQTTNEAVSLRHCSRDTLLAHCRGVTPWKPGSSTLRRRRTARRGALDYFDCLSHFHRDLGAGTPGRSSSPLGNLGWINFRLKWRYPNTSIASLIVQPSCSEINWLLLRSQLLILSSETRPSTICCSCCRDSGGIGYQSTRFRKSRGKSR